MIGELFIVGFHGKIIPQWLKEFAARYGLGGVILFDYSCQTKQYDNNIESPEQLQNLCREIASLPSNPMVFIDQEGGLVRRLKENKGFKALPSPKEFNLLTREEKLLILTESYKELQELGINYNLAPAIDVNYNPENPNIGKIKRSYSANIKEVEENALLVSEVAQKMQIGLCLKHYPGIGGADVDSHQEFMDISSALYPEQEELFYSLAPKIFSNAILISHAIVRQWDANVPITLSPKAIGNLRKQLPDSLLITDDMQMQGLQKAFGTKEASLKALQAGIDMLCIGNNLINQENDMLDVAAYLEEMIRARKLDSKKIQESINLVKKRKSLLIHK